MSSKTEADTADAENNASTAQLNESDEIAGGVQMTPPLPAGYIVNSPDSTPPRRCDMPGISGIITICTTLLLYVYL